MTRWVAAAVVLGCPAALADTATVRVTATIGPGWVEVATDDGWARWSATHAPEADAAAAVSFALPDGTVTPGAFVPPDAWAELWTADGPTALARGVANDRPAVALARVDP